MNSLIYKTNKNKYDSPEGSTGNDFLLEIESDKQILYIKNKCKKCIDLAKALKLDDVSISMVEGCCEHYLSFNNDRNKIFRKVNQHLQLNKLFLNDKEKADTLLTKCPFLFNISNWQTQMKSYYIEMSTKLSRIYVAEHRIDNKCYIIKESQYCKEGSSSLESSRVALSSHSLEVLNEIQILQMIKSHPNIVRYHNSWIQNDGCCIQLEYLPCGSLLDFLCNELNPVIDYDATIKQLNRLHEYFVEKLLGHIVSALCFMHNYFSICHNDIKPSNILIDFRRKNDFYKSKENNIKKRLHNILSGVENYIESHEFVVVFKLADFGRSFVSPIDDIDDNIGDGRYHAKLDCPDERLDRATTIEERQQMTEILIDYSIKRDIHSLGVVIYQSLGNSVCSEVGSRIRNEENLDWSYKVDSFWHNLIKKMTKSDFSKRISARQIINEPRIKKHVLIEAKRCIK